MESRAAEATKSFRYYEGDGTKVSERGLKSPLHQSVAGIDHPAGYVAERDLRDAVNVALLLGQPLLVTGEPGTGKTQLAHSIAYELELPPPFVFHTKTTSSAKDLFYRYDALRHFHDANVRKELKDTKEYITYEALGRAILLASGEADDSGANGSFMADLQVASNGQERKQRAVVLIDEIDKAPRDFPNDILHEIEKFSFTVIETGETFSADESHRPVVVLTSNSERNLPDAFLRRCVFYHIPFPDRAQLKTIVEKRLKLGQQFVPLLDRLIEHFEEIRELALKKKPSTAELLAWLRVLNEMQISKDSLGRGQAEALAFTYSILAKNNEDSEIIRNLRLEIEQ